MRKNKNTMRAAIGCLGLLGLLAAPGAVLAIEPGTSTIQITGTVPPITYLPPPAIVAFDNATFAAGTVAITDLVDAAGRLKIAAVTLNFEGVTTNYPARVAFTSTNNGLKALGVATPIAYRATATALNEPLDVACNFGQGQAANCVSTDAAITLADVDIQVEITTDSTANNDLVFEAGTYTDTLVFKVGATL